MKKRLLTKYENNPVMCPAMMPDTVLYTFNPGAIEHNGETTYYADLQKAFDGFAPNNYTYGGTYVVTLLVLIITSMRKKREHQPPQSLGLSYFREDR